MPDSSWLEKGENVLDERNRQHIKVFFSQFCDLLIVILLIAALISMFSGNIESTIVIFLVLIMNAGIRNNPACQSTAFT